jgi:type II secretory pathway pseudopilin PulG
VKTEKGFTFMELMVVGTIIVVIMALAVPRGLRWYSDYRFSAGARAFLNAGQLVRVKAIEGKAVLRIASLAGTGNTFTVVTEGFTVTLDHSPATGELPVIVGDFVTLDGFNTPAFINGNIFEVTQVGSVGTITSVGSNKWRVDSLTFNCKSCRGDAGSETCLAWPSGVASPINTTTGMATVSATLTFAAMTGRAAKSYDIVRRGNSINCMYDPDVLNVAVQYLQSDSSWDVVSPAKTVVFNATGGTRELFTYRVEVKYVKQKTIWGTQEPAAERKDLVFTVLPSGRTRWGY